ncbi:hypothetical protein DFP72DRAFT_852312 [Ephemerocybe angulata]|uniref:Uncharacterized protein n=1 Tax=Ephemerocybe angulata TaxID=980116 RepID=A0A8H6HQ31_9AGAR|nr:hypothetical protein DFP72DRAFT_852312 [Tulosesus angulatus]
MSSTVEMQTRRWDVQGHGLWGLNFDFWASGKRRTRGTSRGSLDVDSGSTDEAVSQRHERWTVRVGAETTWPGSKMDGAKEVENTGAKKLFSAATQMTAANSENGNVQRAGPRRQNGIAFIKPKAGGTYLEPELEIKLRESGMAYSRSECQGFIPGLKTFQEFQLALEARKICKDGQREDRRRDLRDRTKETAGMETHTKHKPEDV